MLQNTKPTIVKSKSSGKPQLLNFQSKALEYARRIYPENPAFFLDMRVGKTIVAISWAIERKFKRVLVVCPKNATNSWLRELKAWNSDVRIEYGKLEDVYAETEWAITNAENLIRYKCRLNEHPWDCIIVDESHIIKNASTRIYRTLKNKYSQIKAKALLTGTPKEGKEDLGLFTQLLFLRENVLGFKDFWSFRQRGCYNFNYSWYIKKPIKEKFYEYVQKTCFRLTQEQAGFTAEKRFEKHYIVSNRKQRELLQQLAEHYWMNFNGKKYEAKHTLPILLWEARIADGMIDGKAINKMKMFYLLNFIQRNWDKQFVVWFRFNDSLRWAQREIERKGLGRCATITGEDSIDDRREIEDLFLQNKIRIILCQIKAAKYALNLSTADFAIYYSNSFSGEERIQSEMRPTHYFRKKPLITIDLLTRDTIDEDIYKLLSQKKLSAKKLWEHRGERYVS